MEYERGRNIVLRERGFSYHKITEIIEWDTTVFNWNRDNLSTSIVGYERSRSTTGKEDWRFCRLALLNSTASAKEI